MYASVNKNSLECMDKEKNLFLAKKYMVESIYNASNIEGIAMTFPETQTICDGMSVAGKSVDDINAVCDMKKAYQWALEHVNDVISVKTVKMINMLTGKFTIPNSGVIRTVYDEQIRVLVGNGEYYYPPVPPAEDKINKQLKEIQEKKGFDKYLDLFCFLAKSQLFMDGNKRTATIVTCMAMVRDGQGIFSIPANEKLQFYNKLTDYYKSDIFKPMLKEFLVSKCVQYNKTIENFKKQHQKVPEKGIEEK